jgi:hypothetical protein
VTVRLAAAVIAAVALAGCGSATFSAEELIAEINRNGGALALGEPLAAPQDGPEIHSLTFTNPAGEPGDVHAAGTLVVMADEDAALTEYRRCESAASLVCFRVANAVLVFEGAVPEADLMRLGRAIQAMGSD